jgi:hypothetical protein
VHRNAARANRSARSRRSFEDALPQKWIEFTRINAAHLEGPEVVDGLVGDYCERNALPATEGQR